MLLKGERNISVNQSLRLQQQSTGKLKVVEIQTLEGEWRVVSIG